jgi:hypothetical protein
MTVFRKPTYREAPPPKPRPVAPQATSAETFDLFGFVGVQRTEGIAETGYLDAETMVRLDIRERVFGPVSQRARLQAAR